MFLALYLLGCMLSNILNLFLNNYVLAELPQLRQHITLGFLRSTAILQASDAKTPTPKGKCQLAVVTVLTWGAG